MGSAVNGIVIMMQNFPFTLNVDGDFTPFMTEIRKKWDKWGS